MLSARFFATDERTKREAKAHPAADKAMRELIDLKNQADSLLYQTKKASSEHGDKISSVGRGKVESSIAVPEDALKSDKKQSIATAMKTFWSRVLAFWCVPSSGAGFEGLLCGSLGPAHDAWPK